MKINARFDKKFSKELLKMESTSDFMEIGAILESLTGNNSFSQEDFFDLLDHLRFKFTQPNLDGSEMYLFLLMEQMKNSNLERFYVNWDEETINKYREFFKRNETLLALYDSPKSIFKYYKDIFNWDILLINTFIEKFDSYNETTYQIIEELYGSIFKLNSSSPLYMAASEGLFFYTLKIGVQYPFSFIKQSVLEKSTTFAEFILENNLISWYIEHKDTDEWSNAAFLDGNFGTEEEPFVIQLPIDSLMARLVLDADILKVIEINEIEIDENKIKMPLVKDSDIDNFDF
ncbi:MAG: hypothetical protein K9L02_03045 [Acholeplasmataceae bacterium]|nr:hypothetical protein [Acholeplasmataceae bacterium]